MVSSRGQNKGCLDTFVNRKTQFYMTIKMNMIDLKILCF